jgi:hypothetical protein
MSSAATRQDSLVNTETQRKQSQRAWIVTAMPNLPTLHVHPKKKNTYGKRTASLSPAIPWSPDQLEIVNHQQCPTDQAIPA